MNEEMSILECQELAKDLGFNCSTFEIVGPGGRRKAKWLDAYFGLYQLEGEEGFVVADWRQFKMRGLHCENFQIKSDGENHD